MRILEARQALDDCIAAQEFSNAAQFKDSITELENQRNLVLQEAAEGSQPVDREVRTEKARLHACTRTHTSWAPAWPSLL